MFWLYPQACSDTFWVNWAIVLLQIFVLSAQKSNQFPTMVNTAKNISGLCLMAWNHFLSLTKRSFFTLSKSIDAFFSFINSLNWVSLNHEKHLQRKVFVWNLPLRSWGPKRSQTRKKEDKEMSLFPNQTMNFFSQRIKHWWEHACPWTNSSEWWHMLPHPHDEIPLFLFEARLKPLKQGSPTTSLHRHSFNRECFEERDAAEISRCYPFLKKTHWSMVHTQLLSFGFVVDVWLQRCTQLRVKCFQAWQKIVTQGQLEGKVWDGRPERDFLALHLIFVALHLIVPHTLQWSDTLSLQTVLHGWTIKSSGKMHLNLSLWAFTVADGSFKAKKGEQFRKKHVCANSKDFSHCDRIKKQRKCSGVKAPRKGGHKNKHCESLVELFRKSVRLRRSTTGSAHGDDARTGSSATSVSSWTILIPSSLESILTRGEYSQRKVLDICWKQIEPVDCCLGQALMWIQEI